MQQYVTDVAPLAAFRHLKSVSFLGPVPFSTRLGVLAECPLEELGLQGKEYLPRVSVHAASIAKLASLKKINGRPYPEFCKEHGITPSKK
jgi:hypothetical protein